VSCRSSFTFLFLLYVNDLLKIRGGSEKYETIARPLINAYTYTSVDILAHISGDTVPLKDSVAGQMVSQISASSLERFDFLHSFFFHMK
jgi:hypothetical protein